MESQGGGYECEFINEVPEDLICSVCHFALKEPVQLEGCGHGMCRSCFNQLKDHAARNDIALLCPLDREPVEMSQVFNDKAAGRRILNLIVHCSYKAEDCTWTGELRHLKAHEESCPKNVTTVSEKTTRVLSFEIEELQKEMLQKDQKIEEYKKLVDHLQTRIEKLETTMDELSNFQFECRRVFRKEKNITKSTHKTCTYEWVIPFELFGHERQFSDTFYTASTPFCFQLCADLENNGLNIFLHRCRDVNDNETGRIRSSLGGFICIIYMISKCGKLKMREGDFNQMISEFNVGANYQRSIGGGWKDFLDGESLSNWLIKNRLHIFCRIDLKGQ